MPNTMWYLIGVCFMLWGLVLLMEKSFALQFFGLALMLIGAGISLASVEDDKIK